VTQDLDEPRGPDVACSIEVPRAWFEQAATVQLQLPRLLNCARCNGGGCDACQRRGAFEQEAAGIAREVAVGLPKLPPERSGAVCLRLPALGARAEPESQLPNGHLLLTVIPHAPEPNWQPPPTVQALNLRPEWGWRDRIDAALLELREMWAASVLVAWLRAPEPRLRGVRRVWIAAGLTLLVALICYRLFHRSH
jgi:hypothetical protein